MAYSLFDKKKGWKEGPRYWSYRPMSLELAFPQPVIGCNQRLQYFGTARLKLMGFAGPPCCISTAMTTPSFQQHWSQHMGRISRPWQEHRQRATICSGGSAGAGIIITPEHFILRGVKQKTKDFCQLQLLLKCQTFQPLNWKNPLSSFSKTT